MAETVTATLQDAERLFQDKVESLRKEQGHAERALQTASGERDKALHEVNQLRAEKEQLIGQNDKLRQEATRIREALAEHRKNVEASLSKREKDSEAILNQATELQAKLTAGVNAVNQTRAQIVGIQQTLAAELLKAIPAITDVLAKAQKSLSDVPQGQKLTVEPIKTP